MYRVFPIWLTAFALGFLTTLVEAADPKQYEGLVVSAADTKLVMTDTAGKQQSHTVPEAAKISVHGKRGKLADLKPGMRIRVMSDEAGMVVSVATIDDAKWNRISHLASRSAYLRTILAG
jgi:hypothetical protein